MTTAVSVLSCEYMELPYNLVSSSNASYRRRVVLFYLEMKTFNTSSTLNLASYIPNLAGIINLGKPSITTVTNGTRAYDTTTANTWSGTTVTPAGHVGVGTGTAQTIWHITGQGWLT